MKTSKAAEQAVTKLGGKTSPNLDDYATGRTDVPQCVLCPGKCTCATR